MKNIENMAVVVWLNPDFTPNSQKRLLETIFSQESTDPIAFPVDILKTRLPEAIFATEEDLHTKIFESSEQNPIILPVSVATSVLGWVDFHIPTIFLEES